MQIMQLQKQTWLTLTKFVMTVAELSHVEYGKNIIYNNCPLV